VSVLCSTSLSPVDDLGSLSIDQIAQLGLSSLQVIYYSEQLFSQKEYIIAVIKLQHPATRR
ncbi:hypothetical protein, partial [Symbiopectobacterium sp.]|uniref:hypothetical protein n=1 Tax=Symbiopectobacterium sp. TaxID=2952789 RepID=UPI003F3A496B